MRLFVLSMLALSTLFGTEGHAATLRASTLLRGDAVRLSDLFDGVDNDRTIGPAPEIGGRIFVEAAQLTAIARQFGVDWHSTSSTDRTVLERPGRPYPRESALAALRLALQTAGVSSDADIDLPSYSPPMLPPDTVVSADVGQLDYDPATGRFTALLALAAPDIQPVHTRLSGRVEDMLDVPVAMRRLLPGDVVGRGDLRMRRVRVDSIRADVARDPSQAVGMEVRKPVGPGAPIPLAELGRPMEVRKGDLVQIEMQSPGLLISAQGVALEGGAAGDAIRVMNSTSHAVLGAQIVGAGKVRPTGGAATFPPTQGSSLLVAAR